MFLGSAKLAFGAELGGFVYRGNADIGLGVQLYYMGEKEIRH